MHRYDGFAAETDVGHVRCTRRASTRAAAARDQGPLSLERLLDPGRQRRPDAWHRGDLLDRRLSDPLRRPKDAQQRPTPLRANSGQVVERGVDLPLRTQVTV